MQDNQHMLTAGVMKLFSHLDRFQPQKCSSAPVLIVSVLLMHVVFYFFWILCTQP